jgi:hypothetical protein
MYKIEYASSIIKKLGANPNIWGTKISIVARVKI